jgi:hypothetical protein
LPKFFIWFETYFPQAERDEIASALRNVTDRPKNKVTFSVNFSDFIKDSADTRPRHLNLDFDQRHALQLSQNKRRLTEYF